jgi:starvation-inducible outer membrane lipoprotein
MKKLLAIALFAALAACVSPPPIKDQQDVLAQSYVAIEVVANSVASAQQSGTVEASDASRIKGQLQQAKTLLDAAAQAPIGSDARANALTQAQAILNLARQYLVNHGGVQ